jgi:hypothetical protein
MDTEVAVGKDRQMKISTWILAASMLIVAQTGASTSANAFDLDGAWTTQSVEICKNIFTRTGKAVSFRPDAQNYGTGFIIEGNSIRGQTDNCTIKAKKETGAMLHLIAVCSTGIMIDQMQLSFKVTDDNKVTRVFPGMDGYDIPYVRCTVAE